MRKRLSLVVAGLLVGGIASIGAAAPAYACDEVMGGDPVYDYVCGTIHAAPEPGPTIAHYYDLAWSLADYVYCTASPNC
jgi:cytochrome c5